MTLRKVINCSTRRIPFRCLNGCILYIVCLYHNKVHTITYYLPACNVCRTIKGQFLLLSRAVGISEIGGTWERGGVYPGGRAMALPDFGTCFIPISIRGGRLCPPYHYSPPIFLNLPTALLPLRLLRDNCTINS